MQNRRISRSIKVGNVLIGANAPISVQSMCNTDTKDINATLNQFNEFKNAGCEVARLAGTIPYEIICGVSKRVPRLYKPNAGRICQKRTR